MLSKHLATMRISQQPTSIKEYICQNQSRKKKATKANFSGMNRICEAFLAIFGWQRNKYLFFTHLNSYFTPHIRAKYYTHRRGAGMKVWVVGEQKKKRSHRAHWKHFTEFSKKIFRFANACCFGAISTSIFFCWVSVHCRSYGAAGKFIYKTEFYTAIDFCRKFLVVDFNFFPSLFCFFARIYTLEHYNMLAYMRQSEAHWGFRLYSVFLSSSESSV